MEENSSEKPTKKNHLKKRYIIAIVISVIFIAVLIIYFLNYGKESTDDAFIDGHIIQISPEISGNIVKLLVKDNQHVKKGDLLLEIDPTDYQVALTEAKAKLQNILAQKEISNKNLDVTKITSVANYQQAIAGVDFSQFGISEMVFAGQSTKAQLSSIEQDINSQQELINEASASIDEEKANLDLSKHDYDRYKSLYSEGAVSKQFFDNALKSLQVSESRVKSSTNRKNALEYNYKSLLAKKLAIIANIKQSQAKVSETKAGLSQSQGKLKAVSTVKQLVDISKLQVKAAKAQVNQLKAEVKQAELDLGKTKIYAPADGYISKRLVEKGMFTDKGMILFAIVPVNVWVTANFKENQLKHIKIGQKVKIKVDAYPYEKYFGHVESLQYGTGAKFSLFPPENAVGSYVKVVQRVPVKIVFDKKSDNAPPLVPGMSVIPEVYTKKWK